MGEPPSCSPCSPPTLAAGLGPGAKYGSYPAWHPVRADNGQRVTGLKVVNSLTGEKVPFVPRQGNRVNWYTCGPTVYDTCHIGHARAYLTMDIMRRILEDHFGYEVFLQVRGATPTPRRLALPPSPSPSIRASPSPAPRCR